jgi:hypothetical protein
LRLRIATPNLGKTQVKGSRVVFADDTITDSTGKVWSINKISTEALTSNRILDAELNAITTSSELKGYLTDPT